MIAAVSACSVSTAHLTNITITKDKAGATAASTFGRTDTIYAHSGVANTPSKVTLVWHLVAEKVTGQPANTKIPSLDESYDFPSDGTSDYTISPPTAGWPAGTYHVEADMMVDGAQKDQKTAEFTVQ
jgi:hypothetical protein